MKISSKLVTFSSAITVAGALLLSSCDSSDDNSAEQERYSASGFVSRTQSATPVEGQDGVGTIYIAALAQCDLQAQLTGSAFVPDADLSVTGVTQDFKLEDLATGTHHLAVFLDDNNDASPDGPRPGPTDLVYGVAGDGDLDCVTVIIEDADLFDIGIELSSIVPSG